MAGKQIFALLRLRHFAGLKEGENFYNGIFPRQGRFDGRLFLIFRYLSVVGGLGCFSGFVLGDFLVLELGDAGGYKLIVPGEEFADVGGIDALLVILGQNCLEVCTHGGIVADGLDIDFLSVVCFLYFSSTSARGMSESFVVYMEISPRDTTLSEA